MYKVAFLSNAPEVLMSLIDFSIVDVKFWIYQAEKINKRYLIQTPNVPVINKQELKSLLESLKNEIDFVLMYNFGIIIPEEIIRMVDIYNFHSGDLHSNRGSSPVNWAILLNWKNTKMSLYRISEKIDLGELFVEHSVNIYEHDVPFSLQKRMEGEIPSMLLEMVSKLRNNWHGCPIDKGIYRPRITKNDYTIADTDDVSTIKAKIRSQYDYKGAILCKNNQEMYIKSYEQYLEIKKQ